MDDRRTQSAQPVPFSLARVDVRRRIDHMYRHGTRYSEYTCSDTLPGIILSPIAIRSLWMQEAEMYYVAEFEKRRNMGLPRESFSSYVKRTGKEKVTFPYFLGTFIIIIWLIFLYDVGWNGSPQQFIVQLGEPDPMKILLHGEWYRLWTHIFLHQSWYDLLWNTLLTFGAGIYLELRHGSRKVAVLAIFASLASCVVGFTLDPACNCIGSFHVLHVLLGMNWADIFINWDMLTHRPSLEQMYNPELMAVWNVMFFVSFILELFPLYFINEHHYTRHYCAEHNALESLAGVFYGFSLALPHMHQMSSSMIFGVPSPCYCRSRSVVGAVCLTAATVGFLFALEALFELHESPFF